MAASYPSSIRVYTTKLADQVIEAAHVNDLQEEVVALATGLLNGFEHHVFPEATADNRDLGKSGQKWRDLYLSGVVNAVNIILATPAVNTAYLAATGLSLTGSSAVSFLDLAGTWNTTGTPSAIKLNVTNTASNAASKLLDLEVGGSDKFTVDVDGDVVMAGTILSIRGVAYTWPAADGSADQVLTTNGSGTLSWGSPVGVDRSIVEGRLTLTSATPVTTADVTAATTVYFALYSGNQIALYSGTAWELKTIAELSVAVPATTNTMYDAFVDYNAGTPALQVTAWTNDTTRATALTTQNGVLVKTGSLTSRYVGSFRTTGVSGQTEDSALKRYVWNYYNRVPRPLLVTDTTDNWTYTTYTWRQANGSTANQVDIVVGWAETMVSLSIQVTSGSSAGVGRMVAVGEDSTTTPATGNVYNDSNAASIQAHGASFNKMPAVGKHSYVWLERSVAGGTTTWYGDNAGDVLSGMSGWYLG